MKWTGATIENQRSQRIRCQEWLNPLNVKAIHDRQHRLEGTCEWIFENPNFLRWSTRSPSRASDQVLCIYGPPGCGKSVLATSIVERFRGKKFTTLFYSFSGMDADRQSTQGLIRTFLWQLLQDSPDNKRLDIVLNLMQNGPPGISELRDTIKKVVSLVPGPVYFVIDGTDECNDPTPELLDCIRELLVTHESTRAVLLGRPRGIQNALAPSTMVIEITPETIKQDIERFIDTRIQKSTIPTLRGDLAKTVSQTLKSRSDGMFLWAKLMIDDLSRSTTPSHVRERLCNLPHGLEEAYRYLLLRLLERLDPPDRVLAQKVLAFTAVACRTLDLKEVQYACALDSLPSSADVELGDYLLPDPEKTILEVCGDFIDIRDAQVRFVHFSAKEFLTRPESEWSGGDDRLIGCFRVDVESSHLRLGSTCLDFLTMGDYAPPSGGSSYEGAIARSPFLMYASIYMISHLGQFGSPSSAILARLWDFIRSGKCVSWMEYAGVIHMESCSFEMLLEDLGQISSWPGSGNLACLPALFGQELARRVREFGANDRCTDRWRLIFDTFQSLEFSLPVPRSEVSTPTTILGPQPIPGVAPRDMLGGLEEQLMLSLDQKVNVVLGLQSYLSRENDITDPLELQLRTILRRASEIPIYGLIVIANFYLRVNKPGEALEVYSTALRRTEGQKHRTRLEILGRVGSILRTQGKYNDAEAAYKRALEEGENIWGVGHANTLAYACGLASVFYSEGRFLEAEAIYGRIFTRGENALGTNYYGTLLSAKSLANALYGQGQSSDAEAHYLRALTGSENVQRSGHHSTQIFTENLLCLVLPSQGTFASAEFLHRQSLDWRRKVLGDSHPDTLSSTNYLANTLYSQRKFSEAEVFYRRALTAREKDLGPTHLDNLASSNNLANALYNQNKFAETESLDRRALTWREDALGFYHQDTLVSASNLAITLYKQGKFAEAAALYRRTFVGRERALGAGHLRTLASGSNLANVLYSLGNFTEAESFHRRAFVGREMALGADHPKTLASATELADALYCQKRFREAQDLYHHVITKRETALGPDHLHTLTSANNLANALSSQGRFAEAEVLHRRALSGRESALGANNLRTLASANNLANVLYSQDRLAEAKLLQHRVLIGREIALGADHLETLVSANSLANVLYYQDEFAEAEELYRRAFVGMDAALGANHPRTLACGNNLENSLSRQGRFAEAEAFHQRALTGERLR